MVGNPSVGRIVLGIRFRASFRESDFTGAISLPVGVIEINLRHDPAWQKILNATASDVFAHLDAVIHVVGIVFSRTEVRFPSTSFC